MASGMRATAMVAVLAAGCGGAAGGPAMHARAAERRVPPTGAAWVGTPDPYIVEDLARDGRWLVLCKARNDTDDSGGTRVMVGLHGDTMGDWLRPYFVLGSGIGRGYDLHVATSPDERFLLFVRERSLLLVSGDSGSETVLAELDGFGGERWRERWMLDGGPPAVAAGFARGAPRLAYARSTEGRAVVAVRDLDTGTERVVDFDTAPSAVGLDDRGEVVIARVYDRDTDGDGRVTPARTRTTLSRQPCAAPPVSFSVLGREGDEPSVLRRRVDGAPDIAEGDLGPFAGGRLMRHEGAFAVVRESGTSELVPASCDFELRWRDDERGILAGACADRRAFVFREGAAARPLDVPLPDRDTSWRDFGSGLLGVQTLVTHEPLPDGVDASLVTTLVDPGTGLVRRFARGDGLIAVHARHYLLERRPDAELWLGDLDTEAERSIGRAAEDARALWAGPLVAVEPFVVDLEAARVLGRFQGVPESLATDGRLLFGSGPHPPYELPRGPLWWEAPTPSPAASPGP